eukprot:3793674-Amphidinium_carterae.2
MDGGWTSFHASSTHISKNWDNCTMVMSNHSHGSRGRSGSGSVTPEQYERQHSRLNVLEQERFGGTDDIMMARRESQEAEELLVRVIDPKSKPCSARPTPLMGPMMQEASSSA